MPAASLSLNLMSDVRYNPVITHCQSSTLIHVPTSQHPAILKFSGCATVYEKLTRDLLFEDGLACLLRAGTGFASLPKKWFSLKSALSSRSDCSSPTPTAIWYWGRRRGHLLPRHGAEPWTCFDHLRVVVRLIRVYRRASRGANLSANAFRKYPPWSVPNIAGHSRTSRTERLSSDTSEPISTEPLSSGAPVRFGAGLSPAGTCVDRYHKFNSSCVMSPFVATSIRIDRQRPGRPIDETTSVRD